MDPSRAQYDQNGALVCALCVGEATVADASERMSQTAARDRKDMLPGAVGAFMVALLSFCVEHRFFFFLMPALAIFYGAVTLHQLRTQPDLRRGIGWKLWPSVVIASLAILTASMSLLVSTMVRLGE